MNCRTFGYIQSVYSLHDITAKLSTSFYCFDLLFLFSSFLYPQFTLSDVTCTFVCFSQQLFSLFLFYFFFSIFLFFCHCTFIFRQVTYFSYLSFCYQHLTHSIPIFGSSIIIASLSFWLFRKSSFTIPDVGLTQRRDYILHQPSSTQFGLRGCAHVQGGTWEKTLDPGKVSC